LFFKLNFYKDEISQYQESRYISAAESCWRIFHLQNQYPNVYQLSVHLENEQNVYFADNNDIDIALERAKRTTLTEWFSMNKIICFTYRR
jgi:hypothetical protein